MLKLLFITTTLLSNIALANTNTIVNNLAPFFGKIDKQDIVGTQFDGVVEVIIRNPIDSLLVSADGRYIIQGDVIDLTKRQLMPVSNKVKSIKKDLIKSINEDNKIIYPAANEKHVIHVFTDVDCPFCRKLHNNIDVMNDLGITIKLLAAPIASLHPNAQGKMEKIWCADNRNEAMDEYNEDKTIPDSKDCNNPVANQLAISKRLSVSGTPAIFLEDGSHLAGYLSPTALLKTIKDSIGE
tara:strand:- start:1418 stop:2137 length:720 start_codon:yes stop_codon:yes gene_type:complete